MCRTISIILIVARRWMNNIQVNGCEENGIAYEKPSILFIFLTVDFNSLAPVYFSFLFWGVVNNTNAMVGCKENFWLDLTIGTQYYKRILFTLHTKPVCNSNES